jgi:plastocyanin
MARFSTGMSVLGSAFAIVFGFGCTEDAAEPQQAGSVEQASHGHTQIHTEDDCDPVTFGALCRTGFNGHTTIAAFSAELDATQRVAAWEYGGGEVRINLGDSFQVDNVGGETHTFSVVKTFGGGRVPPLNGASGNPVPAPECLAGPNATNVDIASGTGLSVTTGASGAIKARGTYNVQCCIHPWMRTTVVVN